MSKLNTNSNAYIIIYRYCSGLPAGFHLQGIEAHAGR